MIPLAPLSLTPQSTAAGSLTLTVIDNFVALEQLAPAWQDLLESSAQPEPMLAPAWLLTWWRVYGEPTDRRLCVGLFHHEGRLVGLAPLCRRRFRYRPGIPFRRLEYLGAEADEDDGAGSEYLNFIVQPGHEAQVADAFVWALQQGAFGPWDEFVLQPMDGEHPLADTLVEAFRKAGLGAERSVVNHASYLALPSTWEDYLRSLSQKKRYFLQRTWRDFQKWAGADYRLERVRTEDELAQAKKILRELHQSRWEAASQDGAFASARFQLFHDLYMPQALAAGQLDLTWLCVRGEPVAAKYNLIANGKVYSYQAGRKMDVPPEQRLGIVMVMLAMQNAMAQGCREYDFLGGLGTHKQQFTAATRPLVQIRAVRPCWRETCRRWGEQGIAAGRWVRDWMRRRKDPSSAKPQAEPSVPDKRIAKADAIQKC